VTSHGRLAEFVDRVEECWLRLGMDATVRRRLVVDLETDLLGAHAAGATVDELVRTNVVTFAVELAEANGVPLRGSRQERPTTQGVVETAILGGLAGAVLSWFAILTGPIGTVLYDHLETVGAAIALVLTGAVVLASMGAAVRWRFRYVRGSTRLALTTAALALAGGAVGLALAVGYAHRTDFSDDIGTIFVETTLVAAFCGLAIVAGQKALGSRARSRP